jgi:hypothetical protein
MWKRCGGIKWTFRSSLEILLKTHFPSHKYLTCYTWDVSRNTLGQLVKCSFSDTNGGWIGCPVFRRVLKYPFPWKSIQQILNFVYTETDVQWNFSICFVGLWWHLKSFVHLYNSVPLFHFPMCLCLDCRLCTDTVSTVIQHPVI